MKKLIIASFVAAFFAACNSTPKVTESAAKVASLTAWVDSIKNVITASPTHDSASWASYNTSFNDVVASIKMDELDEAGKASLTAATNSWNDVGADYTKRMADEVAAAKQADTTKVAEPAVEEVKAEAGKDAKAPTKK